MLKVGPGGPRGSTNSRLKPHSAHPFPRVHLTPGPPLSVPCAMDVRVRFGRRQYAVGRLPSRGRRSCNDGQACRGLTGCPLSSGRCPEGAGHSPAAWALCTRGRGPLKQGRLAHGRPLAALGLPSCETPLRRSPYPPRERPALCARLRPALRLVRCAALRREIAHLVGSRVSLLMRGDGLCARWLGVVELPIGSPLSDA